MFYVDLNYLLLQVKSEYIYQQNFFRYCPYRCLCLMLISRIDLPSRNAVMKITEQIKL